MKKLLLITLIAGLSFHSALAGTPLVEFTSLPSPSQMVKPGDTNSIFYTLRNNTNMTLPLNYSFNSTHASVSTFGNTCGNAIAGKSTCVLPIKYVAPAANRVEQVSVYVDYQGRAPLINTVAFTVSSQISCQLLNIASYQTQFCQEQYQRVLQNTIDVINPTNTNAQSRQTLGGMFGIFQNQNGFENICYVSCGLRALNGTPPDQDTMFELASVTKTFTTSILGKFIINGTISNANDMVRNYLGGALVFNFTPNEQDVTFQQLATFSGGVCFSNAPSVVQNNPNQITNQANFVANIDALDPAAATCIDGKPNVRPEYATPPYLPTRNFYSNSSVGLLGQVLMHIDGFYVLENGFNDWMCKNISNVLNMTRTSACLPDKAGDGSCGNASNVQCVNTALWTSNQYATGYRVVDGNYVVVTPFPFLPWAPAGGIRSNAADMVKFIRANLGFSTSNTPDEIQLIQGMAKAHNPNAYEPVNGTIRFNIGSQSPVQGGQGYAWVCSPSPVNAAERICVKLGGHEGFSSFLGLNLTKKYGVVILFNTGSSVPDSSIHTTATPPTIGTIGAHLIEGV